MKGICNLIRMLEKEVSKEHLDYLKQYLKDAPDEIYDSFLMLSLEPGTIFIREDEKVQSVYFLLEGSAKATDFRIHGALYDFMWFRPVMICGGLEVLMEEPVFKATLITVSQCILLKLPKSVYEKWIRNDTNALFLEAKQNSVRLLEQTRRERLYLFMQGMDRFAYFLFHYYEQFQRNGNCIVSLTRQHMADCTGLSIKTVNRSIQTLIDMNAISKKSTRIIMNKENYKIISEYIQTIIEK